MKNFLSRRVASPRISCVWNGLTLKRTTLPRFLAPEFFAAITDETVLRLQPCIRLLDLSYPADELLIAVRQDAGSNDTSSNNATATRKIPAVRRVAQLAPAPISLPVQRPELTGH